MCAVQYILPFITYTYKHLHFCFNNTYLHVAVGLNPSNTAFSQWNALEQNRERNKAGGENLQENRPEESKEGRDGKRHRGVLKKQKKAKLVFDEVVTQVKRAS